MGCALTIYRDTDLDSTIISNRFIDKYMTDANDAEIKVYLYLVRMMSANLPTTVSDIADRFNHTEKDIMRALKYWEKAGLLALDYNEQKGLSGIHFLEPKDAPLTVERTPAEIVPLKLVNSVELTPSEVKTPEREEPSYSKDQLKSFKESPETGQLLFIAETYLNRSLSVNDLQTLYFIYDVLSFTPELIDYLLQYCVERGKDKFSYIKAVAISWADAGVSSVREAKAFSAGKYDKNVYSIMKSLGKTAAPTQKEADFVSRWYKDYCFSMDIISEACDRTVIATDSHRLEYCEKILLSWKNAGVKSKSDIAACDASYRKPKATVSTPSKNSFNNFKQNDYDFEALEKSILSN